MLLVGCVCVWIVLCTVETCKTETIGCVWDCHQHQWSSLESPTWRHKAFGHPQQGRCTHGLQWLKSFRLWTWKAMLKLRPWPLVSRSEGSQLEMPLTSPDPLPTPLITSPTCGPQGVSVGLSCQPTVTQAPLAGMTCHAFTFHHPLQSKSVIVCTVHWKQSLAFEGKSQLSSLQSGRKNKSFH